MKKSIIATIAPFLGVASAVAGEAAVQKQAAESNLSNGGFSPIVGVSGVFGEQTEDLTGSSYDVAGVRFDLVQELANGFSLAGRFEHLEGDYSGAGAGVALPGGVEIHSNEFRLLLNYDYELSQGFSLLGGIGYGWQNHDLLLGGTSVLESSSNGILVNVGAVYSAGSFWGSLVYTHGFTMQSSIGGLGALSGLGGGGPVAAFGDYSDEDFGTLEATAGYHISEQLAATLSLEAQVTGDTVVEKDWVVAIGLNYDF